MQLIETSEGKSIPGFDVEMIATRMQGWQLKPEGLSKDWRSITRETPDGRLLVLQMSLTFGTVYFRENDNRYLIFSISCKNIKSVSISSHDIWNVPLRDEVIFRGDVEYGISKGGRIHEVRHLNSTSMDLPIAERKYYFGDES